VVTTAADLVRCDYCGADVPAGETFQPVRGGVVSRCRDVGSCERRALRAYDPTILPDEELPRPPAAGAPPGAACAVCAASGPGLYERSPGSWFCRDRAACEQRGVEVQYLRAWGDSSPDRLITSPQMRAMNAAASPQVPAERPPPDPAVVAAHAWSDMLGRKRER